MSEYEIGKDSARIEDRVSNMESLMAHVYKILEHNVKIKKLEEAPETKEEGKKK